MPLPRRAGCPRSQVFSERRRMSAVSIELRWPDELWRSFGSSAPLPQGVRKESSKGGLLSAPPCAPCTGTGRTWARECAVCTIGLPEDVGGRKTTAGLSWARPQVRMELGLRRKSRHSRESGNPPGLGPRLRGDDSDCDFLLYGWAQAHGHSVPRQWPDHMQHDIPTEMGYHCGLQAERPVEPAKYEA